jgi:hypothetical protein
VCDDFKIVFQLSQKDVYRSNVAIAIDGVRKLRIIVGLVLIELAAIAGIAGFALTTKAVGSRIPLVIAGISSALFFPAILLSACYVTPYFAAKSSYRNNANLHSPFHWSFSEKLITQRMATGSSELLWSTFIKARETRELFLLYPQKHLAYPVPKRAFANEQQIVAFRELVRRHVKDVR